MKKLLYTLLFLVGFAVATPVFAGYISGQSSRLGYQGENPTTNRFGHRGENPTYKEQQTENYKNQQDWKNQHKGIRAIRGNY